MGVEVKGREEGQTAEVGIDGVLTDFGLEYRKRRND